MLKRILSTLSTGALLVVAMPVLAHAQQMASAPKGTQKTVTGTVIDVSCKFGQGLSGTDHTMCAQVCADKGIPLAILGDDGKLYVPVSASMPGEGSNQQLKPYAEQKVTVRGTVFAAGGANAIQIASIQ
ncbi:MAG TPA: hypothetical protein VJL31_19595 [Gemmatimonadales bacterium]|jgi:hypothetical protein|nr:hypothetical protein [Gemmatimonadales bacterium]